MRNRFWNESCAVGARRVDDRCGMNVIKIIFAALGCLGMLFVGSIAMLGFLGGQVIERAVEMEKAKQAEKPVGADSSRFSGASQYESASYSASSSQNHTNMDREEWKFGDPNSDPSKR